MRKNVILLLVLFPAAALILLTNRHLSQQSTTENNFAVVTPYPTVYVAQNTNETDDAVITPSASRNIEVISPLSGDSVKSGFVIKGNARTFEDTVNIRLLDSNGNVLLETNALANSPDTGQFGPFEKEVQFTSSDTQGILEVFQYSARDGSEMDKVEIPLAFNQ